MEWLKSLNIGAIDTVLVNVGILTFQTLYRNVQNAQDLVLIMGKDWESEAIIIWNSSPKMTFFHQN